MHTKVLLIFSAVFFLSCSEKPTENKGAMPVEANGGIGDGAVSIDKAYTQQIEHAHKKAAFLDKKMVKFDFELFFGGKKRLDATINMLTNTSKIRIDKKDGSSLIYDGEKTYITPADADDARARFIIFTWTYFFALPYKLSDPGANITLSNNAPLNGIDYDTSKLTFDPGTGDAPDDWYILYNTPETKLIHAAAYIVTYGNKPLDKAEQNPHAIVYSRYEPIEGIPISTRWDFHDWHAETGLGKALGSAVITNVTLTDDVDMALFTQPEDSKEFK